MIVAISLLAILAFSPQTQSIRELVDKLDSDRVEERANAGDELVKRGEAALPELRRACQTGSKERVALARHSIRRIVMGQDTEAKCSKLRIGLGDSMAWEQDHTWTDFFLEVSGSPGGEESYPELTGADLSPLVAPALHGAKTDEERAEILWNVVRRKVQGARAVLKTLLSDPKARTRETALVRMGELLGPDSALEAIPLLEDKDREVREAAFSLLETLQARTAVPKLLEMLTRADAEIRERAVRALGRIPSKKAVQEVLGLLRDPSPEVRARAAETLGFLDGFEGEQGLESLLEDPALEGRQEAAFALARLGSPSCVPELVKLAEAPKPGPGSFVFSALEPFAPDQVERAYLRVLRGSGSVFKESAIVWLGTHRSKEAVPEILKLIRDPKLGYQAVLALGQAGAREAVPILVQLLQEPGREEVACQALGILQAPEGVPGLIRCLAAREDRLRSAAASALLRIPAPDKTPALRAALREGDPRAAPMAAWILGESGGKEAIPDLQKRLNDDNPLNVISYATALAQLGSPEGIQALRAIVGKCEQSSARVQAAWALRELGAREAAPELVQALQDPDDQVRFNALWSLQSLRATKEAPHVLPLLTDSSDGVSFVAFETLVMWGAKEHSAVLRELLKHPREGIRGCAAEALGMLGVKESAPEILGLLKDPSPVVVARAVGALGDLGAREAIPDIRRILEHEDERVQTQAALALGKIGAVEAAPVLAKLLADGREAIARAALEALVMLDREEALASCLTLAARGDDSMLAWLGRRDDEGVGRPCSSVAGGDFLLNAYRSPTVWKRLRPLWFVREPGDTLGEALERIATVAGLKISWPTGGSAADRRNLGRSQWNRSPGAAGSPRCAWIPDEAEARSPLLRALQASASDLGYEVILETDGIRLISHADSIRFWGAWWSRERKKPTQR